jgi:hypothetical protein
LNVIPFECDRLPLIELNRHLLPLDGNVVAPEGDPHNRFDNRDSRVEPLEIFGLVRGAEDIRIGRVRLLGAHLVREARAPHVLGHLRAAAEFVDERLIEPGLVDAEIWIGEEPVAVKPFDVVAL